jgi:hypothetical protein
MRKQREPCCDVEKLTNKLLADMRNYDKMAALSSLNYCMATIISIHFDGAEGALQHSDQQTRQAVAQLTRYETSSRLH